AGGRRLLAAEPARARRQLHVEIGAGAAELERGEVELRQLRRAPRQRADVREPPRRALAVLVAEAAEPEEVLREPALAFEPAQLRVDLRGPVVRRPAGAGPSCVEIEIRLAEELRLRGDACRVGGDP